MLDKTNADTIRVLYGADAIFSNGTDMSAEFRCQPISVIKFLPNFGDSFEVEGTHYLTSNYRTSHIPIHMLNKENRVGENHYTYFSEDLTKCIVWLEKIKKRTMDYHLAQYEQLKSIPIEIEEEYPLPLAR